jgi:hypothetical protein
MASNSSAIFQVKANLESKQFETALANMS